MPNFQSGTVQTNDIISAEGRNILRKDLVKNAGDFAVSNGNPLENLYIIEIDEQFSDYQAGDSVKFKADFSNTGAARLQINSIEDPEGNVLSFPLVIFENQELDFGEIKTGQIITAIFDGNNFHITSPIFQNPDAITNLLAGEAMDGRIMPVAVALNPSDGKLYKAQAINSSNTPSFRQKNFIGFVTNNCEINEKAILIKSGIIKVPEQIMEVDQGTTPDQIDNNTYAVEGVFFNNLNTKLSQLIQTGPDVGNISNVQFQMKGSMGVGRARVEIYNPDNNGIPTGAPLVVSDTVELPVSNNPQAVTFDFEPGFDVNPGEYYCLVLTAVRADINHNFHAMASANTSDGYGTVDYSNTTRLFRQGSWIDQGMGGINFQTFFTKKRFLIGNPVYLGAELGSIYLQKRSRDFQVGRIISPTEILIEPAKKNYLGSSAVSSSIRQTGFIALPPDTQEAIVVISDHSTRGEIKLQKGSKTSGEIKNEDSIVSAIIGDSYIRINNRDTSRSTQVYFYS